MSGPDAPARDDALTLRTIGGMDEVSAAAWDACAQAPADEAAPEHDTANPFVTHAFLQALEVSGSVGGRTGWQPCHLLAEDGQGRLLGAVPCYLKSHSQGEYVFDHAFADALHRAGGRYYPKLQVAVPFTPATGPRLMVAAGPRRDTVRTLLARGLVALRDRFGASSVHVTFAGAPDQQALVAEGWLARQDIQFHWRNDGFGSYDDFLATLASRKRKALKRERRDALAGGLSISVLSGPDLTEAAWDAFFAFYMDTGSRKWGRPYLTRAFFSEIGARLPEHTVLMLAFRAGQPVAGALNFRGANALYGRHWGCIEEHPFLHFELCYHQAIDYAIAHGLSRVEAGAQGEHKLSRGYRPVLTRSAHAMAHPGLHEAVGQYLARERVEIEAARAALEAELPFRREGEDDAGGARG
jgi:hypothetical protein